MMEMMTTMMMMDTTGSGGGGGGGEGGGGGGAGGRGGGSTGAATVAGVTFSEEGGRVWHQVVVLGWATAAASTAASEPCVVVGGVGGTAPSVTAVDSVAAAVSSGAMGVGGGDGGVVVVTRDGTPAEHGVGMSGPGMPPATVELVRMIVTAVALALLILATVIGNVFVIAAILLERNLQNVANYLILSLAVADLLVACLVMPLGAVYGVSQQWTLGPELCDMWTSSDVLCCTASILHLVAIAVDRYWAVTNVDYIHQRTARRIGAMILVVWAVAFLVCIAPVLGWKDAGWHERVVRDHECLVSQDLGYQIFATCSSFYVPLLVILALYWRIFQTARKRIRRRQDAGRAAAAAAALASTSSTAGGHRVPPAGAIASGSGGIATAVITIIGRPLPTISEATTTTTTTAFTTVSSDNASPEKTSFANGLEADGPTVTDCGGGTLQAAYQQYQHAAAAAVVRRRPREHADSKRERKAAKTLAIITGAFVVCWLPFFVMAILMPVYRSWPFSDFMVNFSLWLGYFNSTLNPIIYTIFSPEFRHAFNRLLCGGRRAAARRRRRNERHLGVRHLQ